MSADRVREQVRKWRKDLINLSRRNRLIYYKPTSSSLEILRPGMMDVWDHLHKGRKGWQFHAPREALDLGPDAIHEIRLPARQLLSSAKDADVLDRALRALDRRAKQDFMDRGLWVLYVGMGTLVWNESDVDEPVRSPLLLVPVKLERPSPRAAFELRLGEEDAVINPSLTSKLKHDFDVELPGVDDLESVDPTTVCEAIRAAIPEDLPWTVEESVVLGTFTFHKESMYRDLEEHEDAICDHPLIQALAMGHKSETSYDFEPIPEADLDEKVPPETLHTILDSDASQRQCIVAARDGHSFVMDGPPGTGKSQTIANMIAELLANGKTVLFVSEKAAALEVVQSRLESSGLGDFVLPLHSHKATRKEVAQALGAAVGAHAKLTGIPAPPSTARLADTRHRLSTYATRLNTPRPPMGWTLHHAMGLASGLQALPQAPVPEDLGKTLTPVIYHAIMEDAESLGRAWDVIEKGNAFTWRGYVGEELDAASRARITEALESGAAALAHLRDVHGTVRAEFGVAAPVLLGDLDADVRMLVHLAEAPDVAPLFLAEDEEITGELVDALAAACDAYDHAVSDLSTLSSWKDIDPDAGTAAVETLRALDVHSTHLPHVVDLDVTGLTDLAVFYEHSRALADTEAEITALHEALDVTHRPPTMDSMATVTMALRALAEPETPQPEWARPGVIETLAAEVEGLGELIGRLNRARDGALEILRPEIIDADIRGLFIRFREIHSGIRTLHPDAWRDRKTLKSLSLTGVANETTIRALAHAMQWKDAKDELEKWGATHGVQLGGLWKGEDTNTSAVARALQHALVITNAARTLGVTYPSLIAKAADTNAIIDLLDRAERVHARFETWRDGDHGRRAFRSLRDESIAGVVETIIDISRNLDALVPHVGVIDRLAPAGVTVGRAVQLLRKRKVAHDSAATVEARYAEASRLIGPLYQGLDTDWAAVRDAVLWVKELRTILDDPLDEPTARRLLDVSVTPKMVLDAQKNWLKAREAILRMFAPARHDALSDELDDAYDDAEAFVAQLAETMGEIHTWVTYEDARARLDGRGLEAQVQFVETEKVPRDDVADVIRRAVLESWIDHAFNAVRTDLSPVRSSDRDMLVSEFRALDRQFVASIARDVADACNQARPTTTAGAVGLILREAQKKTRHMPIPRLLEQAGSVAQALKPCLMMSPLTVSQFIPSTLTFDVIIFDEASQVRPADAANCIYRGSRLIVAGDQKQLPPTTFFDRETVEGPDTYEEDQLDEFDSVLDLAKSAGALRSISLNWHYRSRHEDLITFSNRSFYDGRLVTFPSATEKRADVGVELYHVNGVYRRGTSTDNVVEAEKVVERVFHHARAHPHMSLGVVAFSEAQASTIQRVLDRARTENPDLDTYFSEDRLSGFFIKNLESVQGDERDIIIFSIGYGPDEQGKITMNFGPLTRAGGERRLNVAITRAKQRVEVVASIRVGEFDPDVQSIGVRHLRRYLEYAERGPAALTAVDADAATKPASSAGAESPLEEDVAQAIAGLGFEAVPQVGSAGYRMDIAVRHPKEAGRFLLGVECDGASYHSSKVARDRDRLRQEVLENLGWRIHRIWGPSWYRDRTNEVARLKRAIDEALAGRREPAAAASTDLDADDGSPRAASEIEMVPLVDIRDGAIPEWAETYSLAVGEIPEQLPVEDPLARIHVKRVIVHVVEEEEPVHPEVVLRRVRDAWHLARGSKRLREVFTEAVASLSAAGHIQADGHGFLWREVREAPVVRVPDPAIAETARKAEEVHLAELMEAALHVTRDAHRIPREELTRNMAALFGWPRRTPEIKVRLDEAVAALVGEGSLAEDGESVYTPDDEHG